MAKEHSRMLREVTLPVLELAHGREARRRCRVSEQYSLG